MQNVLDGHDTELSTPSVGSTVFGTVHDEPSNTDARPLFPTATQNEDDAQEVETTEIGGSTATRPDQKTAARAAPGASIPASNVANHPRAHSEASSA